MADKNIKKYVGDLIEKYDYYNPIKDRTETLRLANIKNKNILDVGTGKGHLAILAAKNFDCSITSIDISEDQINIAKLNAKKEGVLDKIKFRLNNAINIPFKEKSFDVAISYNGLHHCKGNYKKIVKEMFRVAKDKVVITELNEMGVRIFDEYLHPEKNHKEMSINLKELEDNLKKYSNVKRLDRKLMSTFVCKINY